MGKSKKFRIRMPKVKGNTCISKLADNAVEHGPSILRALGEWQYQEMLHQAERRRVNTEITSRLIEIIFSD